MEKFDWEDLQHAIEVFEDCRDSIIAALLQAGQLSRHFHHTLQAAKAVPDPRRFGDKELSPSLTIIQGGGK